MRILIVANYNPGRFSPFIVEQIESLRKIGVEIDTYGIVGKGMFGYLRNVIGIKKKICEFRPNLIHAHYGLSGLCANLQRQIPVVTTYHGSDIHSGGWILELSKLAMKLSVYNIYVSHELLEMSGYKKSNAFVQSCGLNLDVIHVIPKEEARKQLGLELGKKYGLFSGSFDNKVKNYPLAKAAIALLPEVNLIELKGYSRQEVNILMNAADYLLMTSHREGSPQVIKEAMACNTPIVSVDVGDVEEVVGNTNGCYIAKRDPEDIANKIQQVLAFNSKTNGRQRVINLNLNNELVAKRLLDIYNNVITSRK